MRHETNWAFSKVCRLRVFLYEDTTGGGSSERPCGSLLSEGSAMISAVAEDFGALEGAEVVVFRDTRLASPIFPTTVTVVDVSCGDSREAFLRESSAADWTVVIAPEIDGRLGELCKEAEGIGRLLGPSSETVRMCSDKIACSRFLRRQQIPTPPSSLIAAAGADLRFPVVVKPRLGAGSLGVRRVDSFDSFPAPRADDAICVQPFVAGQPVSQILVRGPNGAVLLPPTKQHLSEDGRFTYLGGSAPIPILLARRARVLSAMVARALPAGAGCLGVDMVLGATPSDDAVIELNPRVTTSYVGLRKLIDNNLADVMLKVAVGRSVELRVKKTAVTFSSDGRVEQIESVDPELKPVEQASLGSRSK